MHMRGTSPVTPSRQSILAFPHHAVQFAPYKSTLANPAGPLFPYERLLALLLAKAHGASIRGEGYDVWL